MLIEQQMIANIVLHIFLDDDELQDEIDQAELRMYLATRQTRIGMV